VQQFPPEMLSLPNPLVYCVFLHQTDFATGKFTQTSQDIAGQNELCVSEDLHLWKSDYSCTLYYFLDMFHTWSATCLSSALSLTFFTSSTASEVCIHYIIVMATCCHGNMKFNEHHV
jgi:hypothetical protein